MARTAPWHKNTTPLHSTDPTIVLTVQAATTLLVAPVALVTVEIAVRHDLLPALVVLETPHHASLAHMANAAHKRTDAPPNGGGVAAPCAALAVKVEAHMTDDGATSATMPRTCPCMPDRIQEAAKQLSVDPTAPSGRPPAPGRTQVLARSARKEECAVSLASG